MYLLKSIYDKYEETAKDKEIFITLLVQKENIK